MLSIMSKTKTQPRRVQGFESLREVGDDFADQIDFKSSWDEVWSEVLGVKKKTSENHAAQTDFTVTDPFSPQNQEVFNASKHQGSAETKKRAEKAPQRIEAAIDHHTDFVRSSERASKQETREIHQRLQEIMAELQKLVNSSKVLQMEFAGVTVDQAPEQAGEYHLNFFDWLLLTIRQAREKVENSGAWLATGKKKNGKKGGGYWDMFKKHGTTFGLSNERNVATQTG